MSRLGVLAFGDSITNGGGELQWGVALQSWALWVARGLGLPFTTYAVDGARRATCSREQVPAFAQRTRATGRAATTSAACTWASTTSGAPDWDAAAFAARPRGGPRRSLAERCDRLLLRHAPARPRAPAGGRRGRGQRGDRGRGRASAGALVLDLRDFGARNLVMADHVHPTAFGQVWIAERALDVLAADGMDVRVRAVDADPAGEAHAASAPAGRLDLRLPAAQGAGSGFGCRGSGAPSCASRFGT